MESDDDFDSFSLHNNELSPSPSPQHRRLKRIKKSSMVVSESVSEVIVSPKVDLDSFETLESKGFDENDLKSGFHDDYDDTRVNVDLKESDVELDLQEESSSGVGDIHPKIDPNETNGSVGLHEDIDFEEINGELKMEKNSTSGFSDMPVRPDRKVTKRALDFDDEIHESGVNQTDGKEAETKSIEIAETVEKDVNADAMNEKKGKKSKKMRRKSSNEESKSKTSVSNKRREEKERKAHLEQLHAESQRILREARGVSFKPIPPVQKPVSSILDKIRQRKLEMSKKFSQHISNDLIEDDDDCLKQDVSSHFKSIETEVGHISESKNENVSTLPSEDPEPDKVCTDVPAVSEEQESHDNACSQMALDEDSTPVIRAPVDDTQKLFEDSQTSDVNECEDEEPGLSISSQEEEMGPSDLAWKLKLDSVPDDISDEEDNDKENAELQVQKHSSPKGDPVKAFVDEEAEEEDDSDNDRMRFGDDEEDEDADDTDELNKMIAFGYKERSVDLETRNELHQKWLQEKDAAGTDDLLRRLNIASKLKDASLTDEEEGEDDIELTDEVEEDVERPRTSRIDSKRAKEIIAQMFTDKDEEILSSDDEETEKILVRERMLNKVEEKVKLVSPDEDEDSREVFSLIKKLNTVPETRKKAKTSFFDTLLTGGNSNSSSKSSFLSRVSTHSVPTSSKQKGSSGVRSFIFGRDDSNSRSSMSVSEDTADTIIASTEIKTKKVASKYDRSQSQTRPSSQTTKIAAESSISLFDILKRSSSSMQSNENKQAHKVEISQSVFAAFKIPKKLIKINGRV